MSTGKKTEFPEGAEFVALLNQLETAISPASCTFSYFNYWPIIRFAINYKRKYGKPYFDRAITELTADRVVALQDLVKPRTYPQTSPHETGLAHLPKSEVVFLNRKSQYQRLATGKVSQPFIDGLRRIAAVEDTTLSLVDADPRGEGEDFTSPTQILPKPKTAKIVRLLNPRNRFELQNRDQILKTVRTVNELIGIDGSGLELSEGDILYRIERTVRAMEFYGHVLDHVQPSIIFLSSYSGAHFVCAAARKRGIKVVDIQHGGMHRHHILASHWSNVPANGYELLPDIFWCWSQRSADYIQFPGTHAHRAIVGGNPKAGVEYMMEQATPTTSALGSNDRQPAGEAGQNDVKRVLVALNYGNDILVPDHVMTAFEKTRGKIIWSFRLHPVGWNRLEELLRALGIERMDVEAVSKAPLNSVLSKVDVVLTDASTIVHEAIEFGVVPGVWSRKGALIFDDLIADGSLQFVGDTAQVMELIMHSSRQQRNAPSSLGAPSSQAELIRTAFRNLVSASRTSLWRRLYIKMRDYSISNRTKLRNPEQN